MFRSVLTGCLCGVDANIIHAEVDVSTGLPGFSMVGSLSNEVKEARQRSGTSITVEMALEQGRDVYAVPGRLTDRLSDGCNRLLKDGAQVFLSPKEFLEELSMRYGDKMTFTSAQNSALIPGGENFSEQELAVYDVLDLYPLPVEKILEKLGRKRKAPVMDISQVMITLMGLCVKGCAVQNSSGWFSKSL